MVICYQHHQHSLIRLCSPEQNAFPFLGLSKLSVNAWFADIIQKADKDTKGDPESPSIISKCCTARMVQGFSALPSVKKNGYRKAEPTSKDLPKIGGRVIRSDPARNCEVRRSIPGVPCFDRDDTALCE